MDRGNETGLAPPRVNRFTGRTLPHRKRHCSIVLAAATALLLTAAACSASAESSATADEIKVGVILPDIETTAQWDRLDKPLLKQAMNAEDLKPEIGNAEGDEKKFVAIADDMLNDGVKILVIDPPDSAAGTVVANEARARNIPTIDYDRLDLGASWPSDYAVSFDNVKAGELQARGLVRGVRGKPGANIIELDNPLNDRNALLFEQGERNVLEPRYDTGTYRLVASQRLDDVQHAGAVFEQLLNDNAGQVDGVLTADDRVAGAVISVLRKKGLNGKIPVTGQGSIPEALKAILQGDQFMTVFNPDDQLATAAAKLAGALARGQQPVADSMVSTMSLGSAHHLVRMVLVSPQFVTLETIKQVTGSNVVDSRDICEGELEIRCNQLSIS